MAAAAEAADWQIGDVVMGLYQLTALLGQGGMGRVYKIRHQGWHVDLAVKTPLPEAVQSLGGPEDFEREAQTGDQAGNRALSEVKRVSCLTSLVLRETAQMFLSSSPEKATWSPSGEKL